MHRLGAAYKQHVAKTCNTYPPPGSCATACKPVLALGRGVAWGKGLVSARSMAMASRPYALESLCVCQLPPLRRLEICIPPPPAKPLDGPWLTA